MFLDNFLSIRTCLSCFSMSFGGGGSEGGDTEQTATIRYAPYIEEHHSTFLNIVAERRDAVIGDLVTYTDSPFTGYAPISYADVFFGAGYVMSDFPSLWDMYGKFMAGLDVDTLFTQIFDDTINNVAINNRVSAHAGELEDDIVENVNPRFVTGLRDINSVVSSSFVVGRAMMETARIKALSRYDASLRHSAMPLATQRWDRHLTWNKDVVMSYAELIKFYFVTVMDVDNHNQDRVVKDRLWPFTVLEYNRAALGALQGATTTTSDVAGAEGPSKTQKVIGGALTGAAAGAMVGGWYGAVIGGVLGAASGFL